jgi:hypothetical protein
MSKNVKHSERQFTDDESRNYNDITDEQLMKRNRKGLIRLTNDESLVFSSGSEGEEEDEDRSIYAHRNTNISQNRGQKNDYDALGKYMLSDNSMICQKEGKWATTQFDIFLAGEGSRTNREDNFTLQSHDSYDTFRQSFQKLADKCDMVESENKTIKEYSDFLKDFYFKVFRTMSMGGFIKFNSSELILNEKNKQIIISTLENLFKGHGTLFQDLVEKFSYISTVRPNYEERIEEKDLEIKNLKKQVSDYEYEIDVLKQNETVLKIQIEAFRQNEKDYHMEFDKYQNLNQKLDSERKAEKVYNENLQKMIEKESSYLKEIEELKLKELTMLKEIEGVNNKNLHKFEEDLKIVMLKYETDIEELRRGITKINNEKEQLKQNIINKDTLIEQMRLLEESKQAEFDKLIERQNSQDKEIDRLKQIEILRELEVERMSKSKHSGVVVDKKPMSPQYKKTRIEFNILSLKKKENIVTSDNHFTLIKSSRGTKIDNNNNLPVTNRTSSRGKGFTGGLISMKSESFGLKSKPHIDKEFFIGRYLTNSFTLECYIRKNSVLSQTKMANVRSSPNIFRKTLVQ